MGEQFQELDLSERGDGKLEIVVSLKWSWVVTHGLAGPTRDELGLTYAILFIMHNNLLQRDESVGLARTRAMNLAGRTRVSGGAIWARARASRENLPKGTLAKLAEYLIIGDSGAPCKADPRALVLYGKRARRQAAVAAGHWRLHGGLAAFCATGQGRWESGSKVATVHSQGTMLRFLSTFK